jgi:predicted RNA-binding protein with PIN domain
MTILIDGHNLIGKIADLRLDDPDDEAELLIRLQSYRAHTGKSLTVYFDPGASYQSPARRSKGGIRVRQAGSGRLADDLITRDIRRHRNPRELTVVTSDHAIQDVARQYGAQVIDSDAFAAELSRSSVPTDTQASPPLSEEEVKEWLDIFGQSDE